MAWRFANCLTVHELHPRMWGLPKGFRGVFSPPPPFNASILINSSSWFPIPFFASSLLQFPLCSLLERSFPVHKFSSPDHHFLESPVSLLCLSSLLFHFLSVSPRSLELGMGYSYLLSSEASLASFRVAYNVPVDVDIAYCHEGDIDLHRHSGLNTVFFPLMVILKGGVRFPVDLLIIGTFRFYGLCPDQLPPP